MILLLYVFIFALMGMQLYGYRFDSCAAEAAQPTCPPGEGVNDRCPDHFHCYAPCVKQDLGAWVEVEGSAFNGLAYCERFPRDGRAPDGWDGQTYTYLAMARVRSRRLRLLSFSRACAGWLGVCQGPGWEQRT